MVKLAVRTPLTSCISIMAAEGGFPAFTAGKVSGSIPLISTKRNSHLKRWLFSFGMGMSVQPLTSCISIMAAEGGFPAFTAGKVSGSIPLISTRKALLF